MAKHLFTSPNKVHVLPLSSPYYSRSSSRGSGFMSTILGFCIIFLLFASLLNINSQGAIGREFSFGAFLNVLANPPLSIFSFSESIASIMSVFRDMQSNDTAVIGPVLNFFGDIGAFLLQPLSYILNGLNMVTNVIVWLFSFLVPWYGVA